MEKDDLRKSLKFEGTKDDEFYELRKKAVSNSITRYEIERYEHILREKGLLKMYQKHVKTLIKKQKENIQVYLKNQKQNKNVLKEIEEIKKLRIKKRLKNSYRGVPFG